MLNLDFVAPDLDFVVPGLYFGAARLGIAAADWNSLLPGLKTANRRPRRAFQAARSIR
jgi:hypothetical protein